MMDCAEVIKAHSKFCKKMCASFHEKPSPGWCGREYMHKATGGHGQGKCPWQDEEIIRYTGGKR